MRATFLVALLLASRWAFAAPCDSVKLGFSEPQKTQWATSIAEQLRVPQVKVLQSFSASDWRIVYVETPSADPAFLFFHGTPETARYVTSWSGAARADEEARIRSWATTNAPGIPSNLAACFAWYVTAGRRL